MQIKTKLWGKKKEIDGQYYWLPLEQHLLDTSNVMIQLWNHWISDGQKAFILDSISGSEEDAIKLVSFLGLTHDLGKATPSFSLRPSGYKQITDLDKTLTENLIKSGFNGLENWNFQLSSKTPHALASHVLLYSYGVDGDIASIAGGHHGKPVDDKLSIKNQLSAYAANYYQNDRDNEQSQNWKDIQNKLFKWSLNKAGYNEVSELPKIKQAAQVILQGLLIMADWIASNEEYFPLFPIHKEEDDLQEDRLEYAWTRWFSTYTWIPDYQNNILEHYYKRFEFKPREIQESFYQAIDDSEKLGIIILEAPMGVGKTEAALLGVEQLVDKRKCSGMFFGLPSQATSDGIFPRIKEWIEKNAEETGDDKSIQLVHGKAQFNEIFQELKNADNIYSEDGSVVINSWFTGRKTAILDDFVVATVDQLLLAGLKQRHLALRHLGLSKKVVIIDEVHAYDSYMSVYLDRTVEWLGAYNIPIIILSATLPASRREDLIKSYFLGMGVKRRNIKTEFLDWASTNDYPLITYTGDDRINQMRGFELEKDKEVEIKLINDEDFIGLLEHSLAEGGVVGVIVNTVRRAQEFAKELEHLFGKENINVFHSSFLAPHRREKEKQLIDEIGKGAKRPKLKVVIGTQVLEQSLDIDFDLIFTDFAPIDLLLQRIGRLHRHSETSRPERLKNPHVYIMGACELASFDSGTAKIYGEYILIRSQVTLPDKLILPNDISKLVQKVYENDELDIPKSIIDEYEKAKVENDLRIKSKRNRANAFLINRPNSSMDNSLIGWLKDNPLDDTEESGLAKVRDGADSIEVILVKRIDGKLFLLDEAADETIDISGQLTPTLARLISQQTIRLPHIFNYRIDETIDALERLNLKELDHWQEEPWLKGSLGIILNEENSASLLGYKIQYDSQYGLVYEKEEE